jgi:O-antigen ligase
MNNGLFVLEKKVTLLIFPLFLFPAVRRLSDYQKSELVLWLGLITIGSSIFFLSMATQNLIQCHDPLAFHRDYFASIPYVFYSIYFATGSLLLLHSTYRLLPNSTSKVFLILLLIVYSLTLLVVISSKTGIIAYITGLAYLLYKNIYSKRIYVLCMTGVGLSLATLLVLYPTTLNRFTELTRNLKVAQQDTITKQEDFTGLNLRLFFWRNSINQLRTDNRLITGVGTGDGQAYLDKVYTKVHLDKYLFLGFDAHNQWVMTLLQLGLIGIGLLAAVFITAWISAGKAQNFNMHFFLWVILCFSFSESVLESNKGIVFFALFFCILCNPRKNIPMETK